MTTKSSNKREKLIKQKQLIQIYQQACECDIQAFKPGNVSVYSEGHDMSVKDFILSYQVSAGCITNPSYSLGEKIYYAVKATREAVGCNTNLGIILLAAPLCQAAYQLRPGGSNLAYELQQVLDNTSKQDADWVFKAIALASPGGLGKSENNDVNEKAKVTLTEAMMSAGNKDRIALQYTTGYKDIFNFSIIRYNDGIFRFKNRDWALTFVFTGLLRQFPDSHIERKYGDKYSGWVRKQMITVDDALLNTNKPEQLLPVLHEVDRLFKAKGINPGTTADLTVATVLVKLIEAFSVRCTG